MRDRHAGSLAKVNTYFGGITVVAGITSTLAGGYLGDRLRRYTGGAYFLVSAAGMLLAHAEDAAAGPIDLQIGVTGLAARGQGRGRRAGVLPPQALIGAL